MAKETDILKALVDDALERPDLHPDRRTALSEWREDNLTDEEREARLTDEEREERKQEDARDERRRDEAEQRRRDETPDEPDDVVTQPQTKGKGK